MSRFRSVGFSILLATTCFSATGAASKAEFEEAFNQSNRDESTPAGKRYTREFEDKIFVTVASDAMTACHSVPDTIKPAMLVFIISADGKISRVLSTPGIAYGECIASKLHLPISVPRPPHDNFAISVGVANHSHAEKKSQR